MIALMLIFLTFLILAGGVMLNEAIRTGPHPYITGAARWFNVAVIWFCAALSYGAAIALALTIGFRA